MLVKPLSALSDIDALAHTIHALEVPGVRWAKAFGIEDVGYGLKELTVTAFLPPEVSTDAVMDAMRALKSPKGNNGAFKSVDLVVFQNA